MLVGLAEGRHLHVAVDAEGLPHRDGDVGPVDRCVAVPVVLGAEAMTMIDRLWEGSRVRVGSRRHGWKIAGLERRIGVVDDLQPFLGSLVAAMRVGVVELDQFLIARLEPDQGEGRREIEDDEGLLLLGERALALAARRSPGASSSSIAEQAESRASAVSKRTPKRLPSGQVGRCQTVSLRISASISFALMPA